MTTDEKYKIIGIDGLCKVVHRYSNGKIKFQRLRDGKTFIREKYRVATEHDVIEEAMVNYANDVE